MTPLALRSADVDVALSGTPPTMSDRAVLDQLSGFLCKQLRLATLIAMVTIEAAQLALLLLTVTVTAQKPLLSVAAS